jgi:hypothetical protein
VAFRHTEGFAQGSIGSKWRLVHAEHPQGRRAEKHMKKPVTLLVVAAALAASPKALANEPAPLTLKVPKAALIAQVPTQANAPFAVPIAEPELALTARHDLRHEQSRSACSGAAALCYDAEERRLVYKPARNFMPDLPGLTRENISVKRDRVVFRYSF